MLTVSNLGRKTVTVGDGKIIFYCKFIRLLDDDDPNIIAQRLGQELSVRLVELILKVSIVSRTGFKFQL